MQRKDRLLFREQEAKSFWLAVADSIDIGGAWVGCMRAKDFAGAWAISDMILANRDPATRDDPASPYHLRWVWDGTPPDGCRVVVRCYHGLGDTLQFARFLPALRARAAHVTLEAQPELCGLLADFPGVDRLVPFDVAAPLPGGGCDMDIMELGHVLRAEPTDAAACVPYVAPALLTSVPLDNTIGLCWSAGDWDGMRSVPLDDMLRACTRPGRRLVSLQRGPQAKQATDARFVNPRDCDMDLSRTARLVAGCSVIVTVDTMVAHLAGAIGQPVFLLVKHDPDWRWPRPGTPCPWYPTMRVFHQSAAGEWGAALSAVEDALER